MKQYKGKYKGLSCHFLENEYLRLAVAPQLGGKMTSLFYKPQNFEVFFQPAEGFYRLPEYGDDFSKYDTSGADEMFPTIDPCIYPYEGYAGQKLPDHGDLWSLPWQFEDRVNGFAGQVEGVSLPYHFMKSLELKGNILHMEYKVINTGNKPLYSLWAFHGLAACDSSTSIFLPGIRQVVNVHQSSILGEVGSVHEFPETVDQDGAPYPLDSIASSTCKKTEKYYAKDCVTTGEAALTLNQGTLLYKLVFPKEKVPYLGVWVNEGGFKGEYNCALEPSTGYYDSLKIAKELDSIKPLLPGEISEWWLDIELWPWKDKR